MSTNALSNCLTMLNLTGTGQMFQRELKNSKSYLLTDPEVATEIIREISVGKDNQEEIFIMLGALLDEARMAMENDTEHGAEFLDNMEESIRESRLARALSVANLGAIAAEYRKAGLPVPDFLILDESDTPGLEQTDDFDLTTKLSDLVNKALKSGGDTLAAFSAINDLSASLPEEKQAAMAYHLTTIDGPVFERCALYLILASDPLVQHATLKGLELRLNGGPFEPETMRLLPMIRGWMTKGSLQDKLDGLIKAARRKNTTLKPAPKTPGLLHILASMADGADAQSLMVKIGRGRKSRMAVVLLKGGFGIKDSFAPPAGREAEINHMLKMQKREAGGRKIKADVLRILLESGLQDGLAHNQLPAPGFLDFIEAVGLFDIRPQALSLQAMLDKIDPAKKIQDAPLKTLEHWMFDMESYFQLGKIAESWFEDTAETREILRSSKGEDKISSGIWKFLETRRDIWARRFLQTALIMNPSTNSNELCLLAASAFCLMSGRSIKENGLMQCVYFTTMTAAGVSKFSRKGLNHPFITNFLDER